MKSILQSIKPQYCELIASGKKTIEVRKTRPKLDEPFKVYIYCTKDKLTFLLATYSTGNLTDSDIWQRGNGKVIGEYVCHTITKYTTEFHPANDLFQGIWETVYNEDADDEYDNIVTGNDFDDPDNCDICKRSCLSFEDIKNYIGYGDREFYAWHISDLKIYDKPKELSEFYKPCKCLDEYEGEVYCDCLNCEDAGDSDYGIIACDRTITRPPQSWCYVGEV